MLGGLLFPIKASIKLAEQASAKRQSKIVQLRALR
jgi:hypothetical protein